MGLALLALLAAMHSADAQRRRMPSRTEPIPDTETGRPAGTSEPANPSMMIYGPPVPPLGAPPSPPIPEPAAKPAPEAAPPVAPVAAPKPVAPQPVAAPVVAPPPAPAPTPVAAAAPSAAPKLDPKLVEQIFACLAPGLPADWKKTWVVVSAEAAATAKFYVTTSFRDEDAEEFVPCNVPEVARRIASLSDALPPGERRWKSARLIIDNEGAFALNYDYAK